MRTRILLALLLSCTSLWATYDPPGAVVPPSSLLSTNTGVTGQAYNWLYGSMGFWATPVGAGDMLMSIYDTNSNGRADWVDNGGSGTQTNITYANILTNGSDTGMLLTSSNGIVQWLSPNTSNDWVGSFSGNGSNLIKLPAWRLYTNGLENPLPGQVLTITSSGVFGSSNVPPQTNISNVSTPRTWWVSPSGNNANAGTNLNSPLLDIGYAVSNAAYGDTVLVLPGFYTITNHTRLNDGITLEGVGMPILTNALRRTGPNLGAMLDPGNNCTIKNFYLEAVPGTLAIQNAPHVGTLSIDGNATAQNVYLKNLITLNRTNCTSALYLRQPRASLPSYTVESCEFFATRDGCFLQSNSKFYNCVFSSAGPNPLGTSSDFFTEGARVLDGTNLFYNCRFEGLTPTYEPPGPTAFRNNAYGVSFGGGATNDATFVGCTFYSENTNADALILTVTGSTVGAGTFYYDAPAYALADSPVWTNTAVYLVQTNVANWAVLSNSVVIYTNDNASVPWLGAWAAVSAGTAPTNVVRAPGISWDIANDDGAVVRLNGCVFDTNKVLGVILNLGGGSFGSLYVTNFAALLVTNHLYDSRETKAIGTGLRSLYAATNENIVARWRAGLEVLVNQTNSGNIVLAGGDISGAGLVSATTVVGSLAGDGSGLTNLNPTSFATGTITNFINYESDTAASPSGNELARASWVRGLFDGAGVSYYATTNVTTFITNTSWATTNTTIFAFNTSQPTDYNTRVYVAPLAGSYLAGSATTNKLLQLNSSVTVNAMLSVSGAGLTLKPEIYVSYTGTNDWIGDWSGAAQAITSGTTNLYSWVVANPTYNTTNASGFYVLRIYKIVTQNIPARDVTFHVGTNAVVTTPSHISLSGASSSSGNAYLAANQTWTGSNIFNGGLSGDGAGLTNINPNLSLTVGRTNTVLVANGQSNSWSGNVAVSNLTVLGNLTNANIYLVTGSSILGSAGAGGQTLFGFGQNGGTWVRAYDNDTTDGVRFQNITGGDLMVVLNGGNVGIGKAAPAAKLDVLGDGRFSTTLTSTNGVNLYPVAFLTNGPGIVRVPVTVTNAASTNFLHYNLNAIGPIYAFCHTNYAATNTWDYRYLRPTVTDTAWP